MKKILCLLIIFCSVLPLISGEIKFNLRINYPKIRTSQEERKKLNDYKKSLNNYLNNYDWEIPDFYKFDKINSTITITIEDETEENIYKGYVVISSGIVQNNWKQLRLKRNISFRENEASFFMNLEDTPKFDNPDIITIDAVIKFYAYYILGQNFDRMSFIDREDFNFGGDIFYDKMYAFEQKIITSDANTKWDKRLKLIDKVKFGKNENIRRFFAYFYNAIYFYNTSQKERAALFAEYLVNTLKKVNIEDREVILKRNFLAISRIVFLAKNKEYLEVLKSIDKNKIAHEEYDRLLKKLK